MVKTSCPICGSKNNYRVIYKANFSQEDLNRDTFSARRMPDRIHYRMVKCQKDGLVRSNPIVGQEKIINLYKKSFFNYTDEEVNLKKTYLRSLGEVLKKIDAKDNILEIGCGNGFMLDALSKLGFKNVFGLEPSLDAVNKAPKNISKKIIHGIFKKGIFKKESFKLIFLFQTLDHIPDPGKFLDLCYGILKIGGYILSFNHDIDSFQARILKEKSPVIDIEHTHLYSRETIKMLFERYKFKIVNIYSPQNLISIRYIVWLAPLPKILKMLILRFENNIFKKTLSLKLGNICIITQKV